MSGVGPGFVRVSKPRSLFLTSQSRDLRVRHAPARASAAKPSDTKQGGGAKRPASRKTPKAAGAAGVETAQHLPNKSSAERSSAMLALVLESLDEDKAEDVVSIDLAGKTPIADHMVVASGRSQRHVGAVADHLVRRLKEAGFGTSQVEGMKQGDWVLIDGGDVLIHVFRPEVREFYKLEKMWSADIPADQLAV